MDRLGDDVLRPFLQDVVTFSGLAKTLPISQSDVSFTFITSSWCTNFCGLAEAFCQFGTLHWFISSR